MGRQSAPAILILVMTTLYVFLATSDTATSVATRGMDAPRDLSIAVLPFADMSESQDQKFLADGFAEELINRLTRFEGLDVASRTSSFAYRGVSTDTRAIADELGVATVLEGSVRKSGERLRVTAQLIDAASGYHLWSERFDRELEDVFAVQD